MPDYFMLAVIFVFGLVVGSFLNSLIWRLETQQDFLFSRSVCPHCRQRLAWTDLVPLLSFIFLGRRCRYCRKPISWQYPLVELATAASFVAVWLFLGMPTESISLFGFWTLFYSFLMAVFLIFIFVYDLKHYIIPDEILYSAVFFTLIYRLSDFSGSPAFANFFFSGLAAGLAFWAIHLATRGRGLGFGDVKLAFLMGFFLGFPKILAALAFAFFSGAIFGGLLILLKKKNMKSELPFGPFLVSGTFFAWFFGGLAIGYYLDFLLF